MNSSDRCCIAETGFAGIVAVPPREGERTRGGAQCVFYKPFSIDHVLLCSRPKMIFRIIISSPI